MIQLKPHLDNSITCPECGASQPGVSEIRFESINVLADCTCARCGFEFLQALPVGHTVDDPISIGKKSGRLYESDKTAQWLAAALLKSHREYRSTEVAIEKIVFRKCDKVIILNTLDSLYGHVLLKLYNSFYHLDHHSEAGLVIIIPALFKWLIPKGCAEVWIVNRKLSELIYGYDAIRKFVSGELHRFREVYLSSAYSHPDVSGIDLSRLTHVSPFNLNDFYLKRPTVTFILREDRWWFAHVPDYWFYRVCRKLNMLPWGSRLLSLRQNQLVKKTIKALRLQLPDVDCYLIGLGKSGSFNGYGTDERCLEINASVEMAWCRRYAQSHVMVGVHGSNMLLPTALAAGCVEILPEDRYGNMVQDLSVRYNNRLQLFFYRFADQYARPKSIAGKAIAMIRDFEVYQKNMCANGYEQKSQ